MLGSVYTERQCQRCGNSAMTPSIVFSLNIMESLQIGVAAHFQATPLFSMRTELLASSQSCCRIDGDAWCKRPLRRHCSIIKLTTTTSKSTHSPPGSAATTGTIIWTSSTSKNYKLDFGSFSHDDSSTLKK